MKPRLMLPTTRYVLVEVFDSGSADYKVICSGSTPGELFHDMAKVVAGAFEQICENNWDRINMDFEFHAYQEIFGDDFDGQPTDWSCRDLMALMPSLLSAHVDDMSNDETDSAWGDWSELCQWLTDDLRNGDGIQFSHDLDMPNHAKWLLEWEQDRWQAGSHVPAWWLQLRDLLKDRRWWVSEKGLREFQHLLQDFNEQHSL